MKMFLTLIKALCHKWDKLYLFPFGCWWYFSSYVVCDTDVWEKVGINLTSLVFVITQSSILHKSSTVQCLWIKFVCFALKVETHVMQKNSMWNKDLSIYIEEFPPFDQSLWAQWSSFQVDILMTLLLSQDVKNGHKVWFFVVCTLFLVF